VQVLAAGALLRRCEPHRGGRRAVSAIGPIHATLVRRTKVATRVRNEPGVAQLDTAAAGTNRNARAHEREWSQHSPDCSTARKQDAPAHLDILICLYAYLDLRYCWLGEFTFASSTGFQLVPSSCHEVVW
jgi:hypothetical protein